MAEASKKPLPIEVVLLGGTWLVAAGVSFLWSTAVLVLFGVLDTLVPGSTEGMPPPPPVAAPLAWAFQHYFVVGFGQGALSLLAGYAGVAFLRLRRWSRGVLEAGGWLAIGLSLAIGFWRSQFWLAPAAGDGSDLARSLPGHLVAGLLLAAFFAVIPAVFLWQIRSRSVRAAFASADR